MRKNLLFLFVVSVASGIIVQNYLKAEITILLLTGSGLLIFFLILIFLKKDYGFILSLLAFLIAITIGALILGLSHSGKLKYPFRKEVIRNAVIKGKIRDVSLPRTGKVIFDVEADSILTDKWVKNVRLKFRANVYDSPASLSYLFNSIAIGDSVEMLASIQRAARKQNPGEFDYEKYLLSRGIVGEVKCYDAFNVNLYRKGSFVFQNQIFKIRKRINEIIRSLHNRDTYVLLRGLLLADRGEISNEVKTNFVNSGVVHVLAVSGLHVGYVLLIFMLLFNRFNIYLKYILTLVGLFAFMFITGMPMSVVRATLMATLSIISFLLNRDYNILNSIALAALLILIFKPLEIFSPGFQLSFSAVLSIIYFAPILNRKIKELNIRQKYLRGILLFVTVTLSAQIGTLPFTLIYFNKLSIVSLFTNLLVIPLVGIIIAVGFLTLFTFPLSSWLAGVFASANMFAAFLLYKIVELAGTLKFSYLKISQFTFYDSIVYFAALILLIIILKRAKKLTLKIVSSLIVLSMSYYLSTLDNIDYFPKNRLTLFVPETDSELCYLIKAPDGENCLVEYANTIKGYSDYRIIQIMNNLNIETINKLVVFSKALNLIPVLESLTTKIKVDELLLEKENFNIIDKQKIKETFNVNEIEELNSLVECSSSSDKKYTLKYLVLKGKAKMKLLVFYYGGNKIFLLPAVTASKIRGLSQKIKFSNNDFITCGVKILNKNFAKEFFKLEAGKILINKISGFNSRRNITALNGNGKILLTDEKGGLLFEFSNRGCKRIFW